MESRFYSSVVREFVYRAKLSTGDVLESDNFKSLYHRARVDLRIECGPTSENHFTCANAEFSFGYRTDRYVNPGYCYSEWTPISDLGYLYVSTRSEAYYSADGRITMDNSRGQEAAR